ncbi:MAG: tetratricopeptide repeat protein [Candidatus Muirbacterium halophilum]|nr:tetratricopeptide repeat protein [Candidatus Muirbacterium halophilum]MCK9474647.1 tetratricopeptide repeat protein [Candidatus Muirbacterium halophilum]
MYKNKKFLIIIFISLLIITGYSSEKKARREKNFIVKMYSQGYFQEVLDGLVNFEKLYKKYMDEDLYLAKAESYYNTGDFQNALENYEKCVEISEKYNIYAKYSAAYCYMELKNYIKALKYFQDIADSQTPYTKKATLNTARVFSKLMQHNESIKYYNLYMKSEASISDDIKLEYSEVLFNSDSKEAALNFLETNINKENAEENIKIYDKMADFYKRNNNSKKALEIYENLYSQTKEHIYAFYLGTLYFNLSEYEKAVESFAISSEKNELRDESIFYMGQSYYLKLNFTLARKQFEKLIKSENEKIHTKSIYFITASLYQEKNYKQALDFLQNNKSDDAEIMELKRDIYISLGEYQKAIDQIRDILSKNINVGYNYYIAGQCYYNLQNFDRALANFELSEVKSESSKIKNSSIFEKAGIHLLKNDFDKALKEYNKIPSNSNLFKEAKFKIVDIYRIKKDYVKVLEFLTALETEGTDTGYINYTKAEILYEQKKSDDAILELNKTGKKSTYYEKSILFTANIIFAEEKYDDAKLYIEKNLNNISSSNKSEFMYIYAKTLFNTGDYDKSIKILEEILIKDKDKRSIIKDEMRILLAKSYLKIRNFSQAEANASYVASETDIRDYQIQAQFYLGEAYLLFGNYKQAVLEYLKCALIDSDSSFNAKAYFRAGESYQHIERFEDAVSSYKKAIDKGNSIIKDMSQKRIDNVEKKPEYIEIL